MPLREYQIAAVVDVMKAFETHKSVMLQMPTGTGKTVVFSEIAKPFYNKPGKILILVHRYELLSQTRDKLPKHFVKSLVQADHKPDLTSKIQICSVFTLLRRGYDFEDVNLIIIDEAHHAKAETYLILLKRYSTINTKILGVTATPRREDGKKLGDVFNYLIIAKPIKWYIEEGFLSYPRHYGTDSIDYISLKRAGKLEIDKLKGDFKERQSYELMSEEKKIAEVVKSYKSFGRNVDSLNSWKSCVIFSVNKRHAEDIKRRFDNEFQNNEVVSKIITSDTNKAIRTQILKDFKNKLINVIINVNVLTEGFDCPEMEMIVLARPTNSLTLYIQMIGRVLRRPDEKDVPRNQKHEVTILDNADNWKLHGLSTSKRHWNLHSEHPEQTSFDKGKFDDESDFQKIPNENNDFQLIEISDRRLSFSPSHIEHVISRGIFHKIAFEAEIVVLQIDLTYYSSDILHITNYRERKSKIREILKFVCYDVYNDKDKLININRLDIIVCRKTRRYFDAIRSIEFSIVQNYSLQTTWLKSAYDLLEKAIDPNRSTKSWISR